MQNPVSIFWLRRDLRFDDNHGLNKLMKVSNNILFLFVIDVNITSKLKPDDKRLAFIFSRLKQLYSELNEKAFLVKEGDPKTVFKHLVSSLNIDKIYCNSDYEPYAIKRDSEIQEIALTNGIEFLSFKDQVIFEKSEINKNDGSPYIKFTPYKNKWMDKLCHIDFSTAKYKTHLTHLKYNLPNIVQLTNTTENYDIHIESINSYEKTRDYPSKKTTYLGIHLRFGTISIRELVKEAYQKNITFLNELIWREFFMMLLYFFPENVTTPFNKLYNNFEWENDPEKFDLWKKGMTGFPIIDAGMRELYTTGFMHNRVRMVCASFLTKHLLIDYRWGEHYFSEKLLDFDLFANNGNWQWCAGCGVDAAPYFRIFNPITQQQKFDPDFEYIKKWVPEYNLPSYTPIIEHSFARERALEKYKSLTANS